MRLIKTNQLRTSFFLATKVIASFAISIGFTGRAEAYEIYAKLHSEDGARIENRHLCASKMGLGGNYVYGVSEYQGKCEGAGKSPAIVTVSPTSHYLKFTTNPDFEHITADTRDRTELAVSNPYIPFRKNTYISFRLRIPDNVDVVGSGGLADPYFYLMQLWQCSPNPPVGGIRVRVGKTHDINFMGRGTGKGFSSIPFSLVPGRWHKFLIQYYADPVAGKMKVWADGRFLGEGAGSIGNDASVRCVNGAPAPQHFRVKFGIYKRNDPGKYFETHMDDIRITDTFDSAKNW